MGLLTDKDKDEIAREEILWRDYVNKMQKQGYLIGPMSPNGVFAYDSLQDYVDSITCKITYYANLLFCYETVSGLRCYTTDTDLESFQLYFDTDNNFVGLFDVYEFPVVFHEHTRFSLEDLLNNPVLKFMKHNSEIYCKYGTDDSFHYIKATKEMQLDSNNYMSRTEDLRYPDGDKFIDYKGEEHDVLKSTYFMPFEHNYTNM